MGLATIVRASDPKVGDRILRSSRRLHTFSGRHEGRRDENAARRYYGEGMGNRAYPGYSTRTIQLSTHTRHDIRDSKDNGPLGLLHREVPGLLEEYPLTAVLPLIDRYGLQAVMEGYQASKITGFPFEAEVVASSNNTNILDMIDIDILEAVVQDQRRGARPTAQVYSTNPAYRDDPRDSAHFYEHQAEQALERMF